MNSDRILHLEKLVQQLSDKVCELEKHSDGTEQRVLQSTFDTGNTAWILAASALVLFMTIPGLALYYAGMARPKNVLAIVAQCFTITALITLLWLFFGYSLAFAPVDSLDNNFQIFGSTQRFWLSGMGLDTYHQNSPTIPESAFCIYMLTFAIITPALITGAFADRMKFTSMIMFMTLWHIFVYCPIAHSVWHPSGFLNSYGVLDYAGGTVVEISSGVSGLVCAVYMGTRKDFGKEAFEPYNILLTIVGSGMIWVGWFGFNSGSALQADNRAAMAMLVSQIAAGGATVTWMITDYVYKRQISVQGLVSGAVAGLVAITPASGYVDQTGAFFIGILAGPVCYFGVKIKHYFGYDDALDAFGVHAVGGAMGMIATGFFATSAVSQSGNGVFYTDTFHGGRQLGIQIYATIFAFFWSLVFTLIILVLIDYLFGLRVSDAQEEAGLDASLHGETVVSASKPTVAMSAEKADYEVSALHISPKGSPRKGFGAVVLHENGQNEKTKKEDKIKDPTAV
jgi:Amt family ammonium transporter